MIQTTRGLNGEAEMTEDLGKTAENILEISFDPGDVLPNLMPESI